MYKIAGNPYTVTNVEYDSNANDTYIDVSERIRIAGSGVLRKEIHTSPYAESMQLNGGVAYYANLEWPARLPDVSYREEGNWTIRLQNEYVSSNVKVYGPWIQLSNVGRVICGWHLEAATHVYVKDENYSKTIKDASASNDWFEIPGRETNAFTQGKTLTVEGRGNGTETYSVDSSEYQGADEETRIYVSGDVTDSTASGTASVVVWDHHRRATPSEQGLYVVELDNNTHFIFDPDKYPAENRQIVNRPAGNTFINESQVAVKSRVNRPLEVTSKGFSLDKGEEIRAMFPARLAEEEGLVSYDFYVASGDAVYVVKPDIENDTTTVRTVTQEFGVEYGYFANTVYTSVPGAAAILTTNGVLRILSGRQEQRMFPEGAVPWGQVYDIEFHEKWQELAIATDDGLWFYDWDREGLFRQFNTFNPRALVYDKNNESLIAWDDANSEWKRFDGSGSKLDPSVTTQEIESGGREVEIMWVKVDYDKSGYKNTDSSTFSELWQTVRNSDVMSYSDRPDMIVGSPTTSSDHTSGATSISVSTGSSDSIDLKSGEMVRFTNHDSSYEVASDVTISSSSSGTVTLSSGLDTQVPSGTKIRPDKYRGIFKLPAQERVNPPFRGKSQQIRIRNFDSLRDIQFRIEARINYE